MLVKARKVEFLRIEPDMFMVRFLNAEDQPVMTMQPRFVEHDPDDDSVGRYAVDLGHDIVLRREDMPEW